MGRIGDWLRRGLTAPLRLLLPKNPWLRLLVIALPILLLLAFLEPALNVVLKLLDLGTRLIEPLLQTAVGRIVLLLVVVGFGSLLAALLLRGRVAGFRARAALGRHLQATAALLGAERRRCRELFTKVARYRGPLPAEYPALVQDANLKLARLALEAGDADDALRWLTRVIEPRLPRELRRSLLQLRVQALAQQGAALPQSVEAEATAAVEEFGDDCVLHRQLRQIVRARGDLAQTALLQEKIVKLAPAAEVARERQQLVDDLVAAGEAALAAGQLDEARRACKKLDKAARDKPAAGLLLGKVAAAAGDLRGAIREWGATRSPEGLDHIAELLRQHPGALEIRELLECCPMQGTLLLVARELALAGDRDQAERAARAAARALGPTPTVCAVLAEVLQLLGKDAEARLLCEQAIRRLLAPAGS
ncbi:MAG: hypothetical protein IPK26_15165 [Planctomycetes bacterium]|nr:hypothetical protein [Planctomycetota bacterium]